MANEPSISINGELLTEAQAMTVRVALENFAIDLAAFPCASSPKVSGSMRDGYLARISEVREIIFRK